MTPVINQVINYAGSISILSVISFLSIKFINSIFGKVIDEKIFVKIYSKIKLKYKVYKTKHKPISLTHEFSVYLDENQTEPQVRVQVENALVQLSGSNQGQIEIKDEIQWVKMGKGRATVELADGRECDIVININRDKSKFDQGQPENAPVTKIAFETTIRFEFKNLKGSILELGNFINNFRIQINNRLSTSKFTESIFTIDSLETNLTMDDWIEKREFNVSLLLDSKKGDWSVRFYGDYAIVRAPSLEMDNTTAEYIRLSLLNYYF